MELNKREKWKKSGSKLTFGEGESSLLDGMPKVGTVSSPKLKVDSWVFLGTLMLQAIPSGFLQKFNCLYSL